MLPTCTTYFFFNVKKAHTLKLLEKLFGARSGSRVDRQLHIAYLFVDIFHECDDKVDKFLSIHELSVSVGNQKANVIILFFY